LQEKSFNEIDCAFESREVCHWLADDRAGLFLVPRGFILFGRLRWE
jgi:hypothetical protein